MAVNTDENKQLLLQLLDEHPLKRNNPNNFMHIFNTVIADIHNARFKYNNDLIAMLAESTNPVTDDDLIALWQAGLHTAGRVLDVMEAGRLKAVTGLG